MDYSKLLLGKKVFISAAARGMGKAIAILFAKQGAAIAFGGRRAGMVKDTAEELRAIAPDSRGYVVDLGKTEEVRGTVQRVLRDFGGIDILVNTVGVNVHGSMHECEEETIERLFLTNYYTGVVCAKAFLPHMLAVHKGNIINISSIHGSQTMPGFGVYAGTKGAVNATARAMALDYAEQGIRVNNIAPGLIMSDSMMDEVRIHQDPQERKEFMEMLEHMQPLLPGTMDDIANAALFLASDMSAYVTGQTIMVDGGASIQAH